MDMSRVSVPMYINKYKMKSTYLHAIYAVVAEVSYYLERIDKEINRDYLMNTSEISKLYINRDVDIIIKELLKAAGVDEEGLPDKFNIDVEGTCFCVASPFLCHSQCRTSRLLYDNEYFL